LAGPARLPACAPAGVRASMAEATDPALRLV